MVESNALNQRSLTEGKSKGQKHPSRRHNMTTGQTKIA